MIVEFTVPGPPKGKQRPRICRVRGKNIVYTPKETVEYEKLVKASYTAILKVQFEKDVPLEISIFAFFPIPKRVSKKTKILMLSSTNFPTKKPDSDNIVKAILDGLNRVAYQDDAQICKIYFLKMYAEIPEIKISIKDIREN